MLSDTLDRVLKENSTTFSLEPSERKKFDFNVTLIDFNERNLRRIPLNSYIPNVTSIRRNYSLIINSSEPKITKSNTKKRTKVNFIKLPNEIDVERYGYTNFPLIVELVAQNVLNDQSFMSLNLNGFKQINANASVIYSTQLNYSNSFFTNNVFSNAPWYVGYFDDKKTIEIGQIAGNLIGIANAGKGIKGSYRINEQHQVGAFYLNSNGLFDGEGNLTYGVWHRFKYNNDINLESKLGRNHNKFIDRTINVVSVQPSIRFNRNHFLSVLGSYTNKEFNDNSVNLNPNGFLLATNHTSNFLDKKLKVNTNFRFNDKNFSFGNFGRFIMNNRVNYTFNKKWNAFLTTNYQNIETFSANTGNSFFKQEFLFTNVVFSTNTKNGSYQPGLFYEYRNLPINKIMSRGATFRYSNFDFFTNFVSSVFLRAGYTRPLDDTILDPDKDYFNLELSTLIRYRSWNLTARYNYGAFSSIATQSSSNEALTPQSLRISLQNQYVFPDTKFAIESNGIYSYNNVFRNHTLGLFPGIFYFTNSGWRFGVNLNYTFTSSNFSSVFDANDIINNPTLGNLGATTASNLNLAFNLRKEFAIPIPFVEKDAINTKFIRFLDIDGNGVKDQNETALNNVVIKLNRNEVLTNVEGIGLMNNVKKDKYKLQTFSLEKLNGWFPNVKDSIVINDQENISIPFVRGIKVYGDVIVDRQKIAVSDNEPLDLSRIKISASNQDKVFNTLTNSNGRFEFYLPFGDYIMTMDQGVLGERFQITRNNIPVKLRNNQDGVYVSFYIVEKRRKVIFKDFTPKKN